MGILFTSEIKQPLATAMLYQIKIDWLIDCIHTPEIVFVSESMFFDTRAVLRFIFCVYVSWLCSFSDKTFALGKIQGIYTSNDP